MDNVKRFNKYCKQFFEELHIMFPNDTIIALSLQSFNLLKKIDKKMPSEYFMLNVVSKNEQSIKDNVPFFISEDFIVPLTVPGILKKIRDVWSVLDNESKASLWDHITVLTVLCKRCSVSD